MIFRREVKPLAAEKYWLIQHHLLKGKEEEVAIQTNGIQHKPNTTKVMNRMLLLLLRLSARCVPLVHERPQLCIISTDHQTQGKETQKQQKKKKDLTVKCSPPPPKKIKWKTDAGNTAGSTHHNQT
jgi:hypothetical protein